jgi:hypothetical protein
MKEHGVFNVVDDANHERYANIRMQLQNVTEATRAAICNVAGWDSTDPALKE